MGRSPPPAAGGPHLRNLPQGLLARRPRLPPRASESLLQEALQLDLGLVSHGGSTRNNIVLEHKNYWNYCPDIFGDKVAGTVRWKVGDDLSALSGKLVRLRIRLRDASLFAFRFAP